MRKLFLVFGLLSFVNLFSADMFTGDYKSALELAKKEKKLIAVTIIRTSPPCPWCERFKKETLNDQKVAQSLKQNFIYLVIDKDSGSVPSYFKTRMVPTTYFVNPKDEKILNSAVGFFESQDFMDFISESVKKGKK